MPVQTGVGQFVYDVVEGWGKLPDGWSSRWDVADTGVDSKGNVYLFNRGEHPIIVLDREGNYLRDFGDKTLYPRAHAVTIDPEDNIWLTDTYDHTVRKCTPDGRVLMTLGTSGQPATAMSGQPFNQCTHVAIHPHTGEFFVSDGYANAKVHKYTPDGQLIYSWGEPGNEPGQFNLPHNICSDRDGNVYVADRHNHRVQVFTPNGKLEAVWAGMALPCGMHIDTASADQLCYIGELGSALPMYENVGGMGPRVSIYSLDGRLQAKLCDNGSGEGPGHLIGPHGLSVDPGTGDIYVGEVSWTLTGSRLDPPRDVRNVVKMTRVRRSAT